MRHLRIIGARIAGMLVLAVVVACSAARAGTAPPEIDAPVFLAFHSGTLTLSGDGFGSPSPGSYLRFDDAAGSQEIASTSLFVTSWSDASIVVALPPSVRSGSVRVVAGGSESATSQLDIFDVSYRGVPPSGLFKSRPLDIAVGPGGVWTNDEFHTEVKFYPSDLLASPVGWMPPQAPGDGIFAQQTIGESPSHMSVLGEDVDVASDGRIWFTQGGGYLYQGVYHNVSRIVRFDPASSEFACFIAPIDHAEVVGLAIDDARGLVWFAETGLVTGNAITAFDPQGIASDCLFDPSDGVWPPVCSGAPLPNCYQRYPLPRARRAPAHIELDAAGDVWFTQSWANSIARLSPGTGVIDEFPLPVAEVSIFPGTVTGSFPWQLAFDANGDLWINEQFDAEIYRFRPSLIAEDGCGTLDASGNNPCAEVIFDGSDNVDGNVLHSLTIGSDGRIWFTLSGANGSRVGAVDPTLDDAVAFLPAVNVPGTLAGIDQDPLAGSIWFAAFDDRKIGRLEPTLAGGPDADGDGCSDSEEASGVPVTGGMRDPANEWDFYDVNASKAVDAADIASVRARFSSTGTPPGAANFDRSVGAHTWAPGPPDGRLNAIDIALVRAAYNHRCLALP